MTNRLAPPIVLALLALALAPTFAVRYPGMLDYPNHLARVAILLREGTADANPYYHSAWAAIPNIALDLFSTALARVVGAEAAVRAFLVTAQILVLLGAIALEVSVKGRVRLSPFACASFLFNAAFALGFLNFEFGLGLALCALAAWVAMGRECTMAKFALVAAAEPLLYFSHLFALGVFGFVAGLVTLSGVLRQIRSPLGALRDFALLAAPLAVLELWVDPGGYSGLAVWAPFTKLATLFLSFSGTDPWVSRIDAGLVWGSFLWFLSAGRIKLTKDGATVAIGLAALYLALPSIWRGGALIDLRAIVAAMLILPAFVELEFAAARDRARAALAACALVALNVGAAAFTWSALAPDYDAMLASFSMIGPRAKVLVAYTREGALPNPLRHVPTLAAGFGDAFVANLFAYRGQQPLVAGPDVQDLVTPEQNDIPTVERLQAALADPVSAPRNYRDWPKRFDVIYVVGPRGPNPAAQILKPLASGEEFDLYRIAPFSAPPAEPRG